MSDLEQRVAAGAALLDRERPGWWEEVDMELAERNVDLAMSNTCGCVLALLYGSYGAGLAALAGGVSTNHARSFVWATDRGFDDGRPDGYDTLDHLWLAAIAERRARAESVGPTAEDWAAQR